MNKLARLELKRNSLKPYHLAVSIISVVILSFLDISFVLSKELSSTRITLSTKSLYISLYVISRVFSALYAGIIMETIFSGFHNNFCQWLILALRLRIIHFSSFKEYIGENQRSQKISFRLLG